MNSDELEQSHARGREIAEWISLPFRRRAWRGTQGGWQGMGTGNSLDFQDHRPYSPGDDLRHLNWQAYARTGNYTMKLYRQEVSPALDIAVDLSASMFLGEAKQKRMAELLYWSVESALGSGASLRCFGVRGAEVEPLSTQDILAHQWCREKAEKVPPALAAIPWRHGSLRVVISDLLWPGDSQEIFHSLAERNGSGLLLVPFTAAEVSPPWGGNLILRDCESEERRLQRVDGPTVRAYQTAYSRHFALWEEQALRFGVSLARIPAEGDLAEALRPHVGPAGTVEWVST